MLQKQFCFFMINETYNTIELFLKNIKHLKNEHFDVKPSKFIKKILLKEKSDVQTDKLVFITSKIINL